MSALRNKPQAHLRSGYFHFHSDLLARRLSAPSNGLAFTSTPEKLARLSLEWSAEAEETKLGTQITIHLTHKEIAEFIDSTRETVTLTLSDFKSRHLVTTKGPLDSEPHRSREFCHSLAGCIAHWPCGSSCFDWCFWIGASSPSPLLDAITAH